MNEFIDIAYNTVYKDFAAVVKPATYIVSGVETVDDDGSVSSEDKQIKFRAVFVGYQLGQPAMTDIQVGDWKCLLPMKGLKFKPETSATVVFNNNNWTVVGVMADPSMEALYTLQLRREQ